MKPGSEASLIKESDAVQSEIARLLTMPELPNEEQRHDLLCDSNQLRQIMNFRGFITKVKHNGIRKFIPKTMELLSILKIELEFYGAVSQDYQRLRGLSPQGPIPREEHLKWYETALNAWVSKVGGQKGALVTDMLAHELVQHQASQPPRKVDDDLAKESDVFIEGELILRRYSHDIPKTLRDMSNGAFDLMRIVLETPMNLAYWLKSDGDPTIMEVDDLTAQALSLVDGHRTRVEIAKCFADRGFPEVTVDMLNDIFDPLVSHAPLRLARY